MVPASLAIQSVMDQVLGPGRGWKLLAILGCFSTTAMAEEFGDFSYTDNGTTITITGYPTSAEGEVVIPETIVSKPVTSIGDFAFFNCAGVTSVTISPGMTSIGTSAFAFCTSLAEVQLPVGVTTIGSSAFVRCIALTSVTIPSGVNSIGARAFADCSSLVSVAIPSSVTSIADRLFFGCSALTSVTIPPSTLSIGISAFQYCSSLTTVTIPTSVTQLHNRAFNYCTGLTSMSIPHGVDTIGSEVFANCTALTGFTVDGANQNFSSLAGVLFNKTQTQLVTFPSGMGGGYAIPASVTHVGDRAFMACPRIVGVTLPPALTTIGAKAFSTCPALLYANFTGNAPDVSFDSFEATPPGFAVYYLDGKVDFTVSPWADFPAVNMGTNGTLITAWLLAKGLPANSDLQSDSNGDGVNLLMARALNLDPHLNLTSSMPVPVFAAGQISLSFYAGTAGMTYRVECSENLRDWNTTGVTLSPPDASQIRTATASLSGSCRFMRLAASE